MPEEKNVFIHHVFFWLAEPKNEDNLSQLIAALKKLSNCQSIKRCHIGRPAQSSRSITDSSYAISWCIHFNTAEDHKTYQKDTNHLRFVDTCSHLWSKVLVYDSTDA